MKRFSFTHNSTPPNQIVTAGRCRISILTSKLLRLETGAFTDLPTQTVWYRDLGYTDFSCSQHGNMLTVKTADAEFAIHVKQGKMMAITLADGTVIRDFSKGNLLGTARTLDMVNGKTKLEKGILSKSGVSVMDDSASLLLEAEGKIISRPSCKDLYYFAYGHAYKDCLQDFFRLTGPVPLIPKFALGNWWSRYRAYTQDEYQSLMQAFVKKGIPITVATIDMDWHWTDVIKRFGKKALPKDINPTLQSCFYNRFMPGWTGYSWNTELFPDHKALLSWLHENGFYVPVNLHPAQGIRFYEDSYEAACQMVGKDPADQEPILFDITSPAYIQAYFDAVHHPLEKEGIDFWWIDWQQGKQTSIPGLDPLWALNHYHTLDHARNNKRPLILSRYAGLGSHRYPLGFSGDTVTTWKSLSFQPFFTNNAANAGYTWWSHDIGGHMRGTQDDELYLRWVQFGAFSPINRLHSSNSDFMGKEPWKRCYAVNMVAQDFLRLRHKLIPYLYTANYRTHTAGEPICKPMYYEYDCDEAYAVENQYIFGSQLLVCPITEKTDKRLNLAKARMWLPEGRWTDFFTGRIYQGNRWVTMCRDIDSIPVLVPAGGIVPMYHDGTSNSLSLDQPLDIQIWHGNGQYTLYEDDGLTNAYQKGSYVQTAFRVREEGNTICLTIGAPIGDAALLPKERTMYLHFRDIVQCDAYINGNRICSSGNDYAVVEVTAGAGAVEIVLKNCRFAANLSKEVLISDLFTRVQVNNRHKHRRYPSGSAKRSLRMLPGYLRSSLAEFDALYY